MCPGAGLGGRPPANCGDYSRKPGAIPRASSRAPTAALHALSSSPDGRSRAHGRQATADERIPDMTKIAVTGGSGKAGRAVVRHLLEQGHEVLNVDRVPSAESSAPDSPAPFLLRRPHRLRRRRVEALGNAEKLPGIEAVVHLAAIPSPVHATPGPHLPHEHHEHLYGVRRGRAAGSQARRVGLERDDARPAVRDAARLRAGRRGARAAPRVVLRALEGPRRGDGAPVPPLERIPIVGLRFSNVMERTTTSASPTTGTTRSCASGTCGATSTRPRRAERPRSRWRPTSPARTPSSSPPATRS